MGAANSARGSPWLWSRDSVALRSGVALMQSILYRHIRPAAGDGLFQELQPMGSLDPLG
jgi:hypothetical protein